MSGVVFVFLGLLAASIGVVVRLNSTRPTFLNQTAPWFRSLVLLGLTLLFALIALTITVLLVLRVFAVNAVGWRLSGLIILWVVVGPMSLASAVRCARRGLNRAVSPTEETAWLLALAALAAFSGCWALYNPDNPQDWDSMRLFVSVLFLVTLGAVPLVVVSQSVRRLVVSLLIVLHFGGILTAVLSIPPCPWLVQQIWGRVYEPYLEFMYLTDGLLGVKLHLRRQILKRLVVGRGNGSPASSQTRLTARIRRAEFRSSGTTRRLASISSNRQPGSSRSISAMRLSRADVENQTNARMPVPPSKATHTSKRKMRRRQRRGGMAGVALDM